MTESKKADKIEIEHLNELLHDAYHELGHKRDITLHKVKNHQNNIWKWETELKQYPVVSDSEKLQQITKHCKRKLNQLTDDISLCNECGSTSSIQLGAFNAYEQILEIIGE